MWLGVTVAMMAGCATAPATPEAAAGPPPEDAAAYYPFTTGWKWAYNVDRLGDGMLATYAVVEVRDGTAIVQSGEQKISYALSPEGIARRDGMRSSDYLLKSPIRTGATWTLEDGQAKVATTGQAVTVPAGTFVNCALIEESRTNPQRIGRTVYCAGVGPVSIEIQVHDPLNGTFQTEMKAVLLGVTRPGEDPLGTGQGTGGPQQP